MDEIKELDMKYLVLKMKDTIDIEYLRDKLDNIIKEKYVQRGDRCDIYSKPLVPIRVKDISVDIVNSILITKKDE